MSDLRSQLRGTWRRQRRLRRKLGRDLSTPPWRHLGSSEDKYGRLRAGLRRMAREYANGTMSRNSETLARNLVEAATEPWLLKLLWDWTCDPERQHERVPGISGMTFANLELWDSRWNWCRLLGGYVVPMSPYLGRDVDDPELPQDIPDTASILDMNCDALWHQVLRQPFLAPYRRVYIKKPGSRKRRPIDVAEVWDFLIEKSMQIVVRDLLTVGLPDSAIAYREGLGTADGLARALATAEARDLHEWVIVDLKDAYGGVVHKRLEDFLRKRIPCPEMVDLIMKTMSPGRREDGKTAGTPRGLPQGSPLAPFLFNAYAANFIDRPWQKRFPQWPMFRYGDDILIQTKTKREAREAHYHLRQIITSAAFKVNPKKSRLTNMARKPLVWLGYEIEKGENGYAVTVPEKSWQKFEQIISECRAKTSRDRLYDAIQSFFAYYAPVWTSPLPEVALSRLENILVEVGVDDDDRQTEDVRRRQLVVGVEAAAKASSTWACKLHDARKRIVEPSSATAKTPKSQQKVGVKSSAGRSGSQFQKRTRVRVTERESTKTSTGNSMPRSSAYNLFSETLTGIAHKVTGWDRRVIQTLPIYTTADVGIDGGAPHRPDADSHDGIRSDPSGPAVRPVSSSHYSGRRRHRAEILQGMGVTSEGDQMTCAGGP